RLTVVGEGSRRAPLEAAGPGPRVGGGGPLSRPRPPPPGAAPPARADTSPPPPPPPPPGARPPMINNTPCPAAPPRTAAHPLLETKRTAGNAVAYAERDNLGSFAAQIASLSREPERRATLARIGAERARSLGWAESERRLLDAYAGLAAG